MVAKKRNQRRARHWNAKLDDDSVHAIRATYATGAFSQYQMAKWFAVTQGQISHIVSHRSW
jgi:predicted XRE-type DNA-binding protein